jgi:hypothetical protein
VKIDECIITGDDKVPDGEDEGTDPKEAEKVEDDGPARVFVCDIGVRLLVPLASRSEKEHDYDKPKCEGAYCDPLQNWEEERRWDLGEARGSLLDDLDRHVNPAHHDA